MTAARRPAVLVSVGDPNGIGPEIAVKAARALARQGGPRAILVSDRHGIAPVAAALGLTLTDARREGAEAKAKAEAEADAIAWLPCDGIAARDLAPGRPTAASGRATLRYLRAALDARDEIGCAGIVACPHSQTAVNAAGFRFSGYPSLLAGWLDGARDGVFLMLVGGGLRVTHVTLHEALAGALARIDGPLIERAARVTHRALVRQGVARPRIGVMGVDPHAGEDGLFGTTDADIVRPAVERLRGAGLDVDGPEGADVLLCRPGFDAFMAMYHDQGHVPVKLLAGKTAVAMSIGPDLSFASVGHGAAFDIAGKGIADPTAVIRAIETVAGDHGRRDHD